MSSDVRCDTEGAGSRAYIDDASRTIEDKLASAVQEVERLDAQIGAPRNNVKLELSSRGLVETRNRGFIGVLSSPHRLPPELLAEIFVHCLDNPLPSIKRDTPLHRLTHVCTFWREVALSTPRFWCSFTIAISCQPKAGGRVSLLRSWLSRSASLPLSISISYDGHLTDAPYRNDKWIIQSLALLANHLPRCKFLSFDLNPDILDLLPSYKDLPLLEALRITSDELEASTFGQIGRLFASSPRLKTYQTNWPADFHLIEDLPWCRLTTLRMNNQQYVGSCMPILAKCRNLILCSLEFHRAECAEFLADLLAFSCREHQPDLDRFIMPLLEELELSIRSYRTQVRHESLCDMLSTRLAPRWKGLASLKVANITLSGSEPSHETRLTISNSGEIVVDTRYW
ncbi:hypothetical protein NEOLEDRAFT_1151334 [Neolentinus lepideus HHB14362 ss-1]|uniref:Uncharacterized protein n=1 Tax=Neolentinus lepideus HHB14362 ss-1 TaxID=1314782 RepID=A0A165P2X3_9AGAM|nr:hypothetical protein NEOLEDRAFT_1151334 [Neolentinus lepideus HHB14362 ss-1]